MGRRIVLVVAVCVGLLATGTAPALANSGDAVAIRIVVTGRLAGQSATLRVHDRDGVRTVRVSDSRTVRVRAGRVTIVPSPIVIGTPSTARIRRFAAERGDTVRLHYRKDETSRPGVLTPVARGTDGEPATAGNLVPSPDRTRLAFISRDPDLLGPDESGGLFVRELSTGVVTKLARDAAGGIEWSPDSRRIAFRTDAATPAIHVKDLETGDVTVATPRSVPVAWADSDHLVMSVCRTARHCGIGVQDLATGRVRRVVPVAHRVERWTLAPDGRSLLFESREDPLHRGIDRRSLYRADVETAKMAVLHTTAGGRPVKGASWAAVWSPDSHRVAFRSARGRFSRIMVKNLISGSVKRLTTASDHVDLTEPIVQWAPTSKVLAFRSADGTVSVKRLATGTRRRLVSKKVRLPGAPVVTGYTFAPSGKRIAFLLGSPKGCWTDAVPFADLNCRNVLVKELASNRLVNISTFDTGLGWRGTARDGGSWSPVWLSEDDVVIRAPRHVSASQAAYPMIKTVQWPPPPASSPAPRVSPWCDPYRYWWSC